MQGLMEAQKDPAVLAQLLKDMQVRFMLREFGRANFQVASLS
jgi:hypothetical protein